LLQSLPALTLVVLGARVPASVSYGSLAMTTLVGPFAEEFLFRGFLVNRLRIAGISMWPAILTSGLMFGAAHLSNVWHGTTLEIAGEVAITGAGGALFGWSLWQFKGSFWAAFSFHAGLNLSWDLFAVDQTAIGGVSGNLARAAGIMAGVMGVITISRLTKVHDAPASV